MKSTTMKYTLPLMLLVLMSVSACSQHSVNKSSNSKSAKHGAQTEHDQKINVLDLKAIQPLDTLSNELDQYRVVLVGESHTNYGHHLNQLAVIKKTHYKWGAGLSIGLEMVQQPFQSALDDYIAGRINERQMLRKVEWYKRWKYDFRLYRPIFDYAKANKIPLIALNIPQEVTKRVAKVGIKGLSSKDRALLPKTLDRSNKDYEARLKTVYSMHSHGVKNNSKAFDNFYDAQLAWDEGMAFAAANYLKKYPKRKMVVITGSGHLINREGIPSRLDRQLNNKKHSLVILSSSSIQSNPSSKNADYLLYSPEAKLPPAGLIGIMMGEADRGVIVNSVIDKGAATKAGIQAKDVIIAIDNQTIKETSDVSLWRLDKKPGDKAMVKLLRNNKTLIKTLVLGKPKKHGAFDFSRIHKK
ncbi:ChaN family lipoprotein [Cocleimonas sp. KMM 6892]|uniref:ChaN family lipoprotein n=1 Tax=unclassified Cocleimonas TaxID=2639732 RepID=UPI002DBB9480|nr:MULTISPECIES: ChaN family lipoprotein [unclassified Cocleimonas]MEB8431321.1 ChaN family lipoprotein [Cocleimonas sp. KMM 6892]MEC4713907.1 ChaN family lipoprotein [Cocleimonas sp. KMM 6895]MEC4743238.1 ChaN family lipoprotein [Cocleimonas sp. KMM 6896]